jgi:hypothetical protein
VKPLSGTNGLHPLYHLRVADVRAIPGERKTDGVERIAKASRSTDSEMSTTRNAARIAIRSFAD